MRVYPVAAWLHLLAVDGMVLLALTSHVSAFNSLSGCCHGCTANMANMLASKHALCWVAVLMLGPSRHL